MLDLHPEQITIPIGSRIELIQLASSVALKRAELEVAQLRQELAVFRLIEVLGIGGKKLSIDLDAGFVHILADAAVEPEQAVEAE